MEFVIFALHFAAKILFMRLELCNSLRKKKLIKQDRDISMLVGGKE